MTEEGLTGREDGQLSFVLYDNWRVQLLRLDLTQRGVLLTNIFAHRVSQPLLEMDPVTDMLFSIICDQLDRGVTLLDGEGYYSHTEKTVLLCAVKRKQLAQLKEIVMTVDPNAFLILQDAHQVLGDGFKRYDRNEL